MKNFYTLINKLNKWFWQRIVSSTFVNIESLSVLRIITGFFILLFFFPSFGWIGEAPNFLYNPPLLSLGILFDHFPSTSNLLIIDILLLILALFITIGIRAKISTLLYCLLSFIALTFNYSFGKIDHSILFYIMLLCLAFSGWGSKLALIPDNQPVNEVTEKCLSLLAFVICFSFFSAGYAKLLNWVNIDFTTSGLGSWYYFGYYNHNRHYLLANSFGNLPFGVLKLFDYLGSIFEISALLFLLHSRKSWLSWLFLATLFHILNLLILNIPFYIHSVIYLTFFDLSFIYYLFYFLLKNKFTKIFIMLFLLAIIISRGYFISKLELVTLLFIPDYLIYPNLIVCLILWLMMALFIFFYLFGHKLKALTGH